MMCVRNKNMFCFDVNTPPVVHCNYRCFGDFPPELLDNCDNITDIYMKENNLYVFPRELCRFRYLKNLYLCGNNIRELPKDIQLIQSLSCLDLSGNLLIALPEEVSNLRNLKYLILDDNMLRELPLSLKKSVKLRDLSVNDNQLLWLPQRPLSNYYAGKFEFWGNRTLQHVPFTLWLHLLKDLQIRRLHIGCFQYPYKYKEENLNRIKVLPNQYFPGSEIVLPYQLGDIQKYPNVSPPPLIELCLRKCYRILDDADRDNENNNWSQPPADRWPGDGLSDADLDENGNVREDRLVDHLPGPLRSEILNGPPAYCDIYTCRGPIFRSAVLDVILRPIILPEETPDVLVTALFCSASCCVRWRAAHYVAPLHWEAAPN